MTEQSPWPNQQPGDSNPVEATASATAGESDSSDIQEFIDHFKAHASHRAEWVKGTDLLGGADADFAFVAGHQWSEDDLELLQNQGRPAITFNRTGAYIDSVSGLEVNNRQEVRFIPRVEGKAAVDELATAAAKWARDGCDAEDEESNSFRDCLVCGEGWTQTVLCFDDDPDGMVLIQGRDPREIYPDPGASRANYSDMRRVFYKRTMPREDAEAMFPDVDPSVLDASWARDTAEENPIIDRRAASFYRGQANGETAMSDDVTIVECEWWEYEVAHRVKHPVTGRLTHMQPDAFKALQAQAKAAGGKLTSVKDRVKRYYRAVLGQIVLAEGPGPLRGGFTLKAITGKRDQKKHCWYGLVRPMRDPQMWSNKFLSQYLHIINSNAKGGLIIEADAMLNKDEFLDNYARPDGVSIVAPGAISQGKIKDKQPPQFPQGVQYLLQYAISSISDVAGSNPEMMGQADRAQAGVVDEHRKQAAMVIYAGMFANLRRYRKEQGRLLLWYLQTFIADNRLIRIGGPEDAAFVPLMRDKMLGEYDIVVDDTPTSPNMKERAWGAITALFPVLSKLNLPPAVMLALMEYSPVPATLLAKIKGMMPPPQNGPNPQQQAEMAKAQADAALAQARARHTQVLAAKAQSDMQLVPLDLQEKQANIELAKAQAIQALSAAGLAADDQRFQQAMDSINALVGIAGAHLDAQDQAHSQAIATQQAMQPPLAPAPQQGAPAQ